ncbi:MAG: hypothetical protein D6706_10880 [Chloroflexi bacterium]|nr:MAG: hypothetical protein D6706_10880 [Chloroflexota bacterium]
MRRISLGFSMLLSLLLLAGVLAILPAGTAVAVPPAQTAPFADPQEAATEAVRWLVTAHQNDDGGYTSFSSGANQAPSDVGGTADAIQAIVAAGFDPAQPLFDQENTPVMWLNDHSDEVAAYASIDGSTAGKVVLALVAAGQDPRAFGDYNLVISLTQHLSPTGQLNVTTPFGQAVGILGLAAAGEPVPDSAVSWLLSTQSTEDVLAGSWDDGFGTLGNPDATGMAVMALLAAGLAPDDPALQQAADFLMQARLESGGWEYGPGFGENVNSTALAIQALAALGQDVSEPVQALLNWQSESGAFQADFGSGPFDDFFSTVQAIPAVVGKPFPIRPGVEPVPVLISEPTETAVPPTATVTAVPTNTPLPTETAVPPTATMISTPVATATSAPQADTTDGGNATMLWVVAIVLLVLIAAGIWYARQR